MISKRARKLTSTKTNGRGQPYRTTPATDLRSHGLRFHADPFSPIAYYPYEYSEAERKFLQPWVVPTSLDGLCVIRPAEPMAVNCSGGLDHLSVQPYGSACRCILDRQLGVNPLGNVFDPGFRLLDESRECAEFRRCPACDRDKVTTVRLATRTAS